MVYKEYKHGVRGGINGSVLAAMPELLVHVSPEDRRRLLALTSWPHAVVTQQGNTTGFVMPSIPDEFYLALSTAAGEVRAPAELQHLLNDPVFLQQRGIRLNDQGKYGLIRAVAMAMTFLHATRICIGDLSPKNILFVLGQQPKIYFIDCDAMRVAGQSVSAQLETPGWETVRGEELATPQTDSYKLGLLALRLLVGDQDTRDVGRLPASVPYDVRSLIMDALSRPTASRPAPAAWDFALARAVELAHSQPAPAAPKPTSPPRVLTTSNGLPPGSSGASSQPILLGIAAVVVVSLLAVLVTVIVKNNGADEADQQSSPQASRPSDTYTTTTQRPRLTTTTRYTSSPSPPTTPTQREVPPEAVSGPDTYGERCDRGFELRQKTGWATAALRGSDVTSCDFADNVLRAYWSQHPEPSMDLRAIDVPGGRGLSCQSVPGATCRGDEFVMRCQVRYGENWITCEGGNRARVYLF